MRVKPPPYCAHGLCEGERGTGAVVASVADCFRSLFLCCCADATVPQASAISAASERMSGLRNMAVSSIGELFRQNVAPQLRAGCTTQSLYNVRGVTLVMLPQPLVKIGPVDQLILLVLLLWLF